MRPVKLFVLFGAALMLGGCTDILGNDVIHGSGRVVDEVRATSRFVAVSNATSADIDILQGSRERILIRAEENLLPYIRTRVQGGVLQIYTEGGVTLRPNQPIVIELDVVTLRALMSSGSGDIYAPVIDAAWLDVTTSGSGDILLPDLLADSLIISSSGSGDVAASGDVILVGIVHSGAGAIDTRELLASEVDAVLSGSGTSTVRARDWISVVVAGAGSLRYYGNPVVQSTVTGAGRVQRVGS